MSEYLDKVVVITGGARGFGKAFGAAFADQGATVACAPHMIGRDSASIINISSAAAYLGTGYGVSKLAVCGLTMTLAREMANDGVRVNAVAPGIIPTETIKNELDP